MKIAHLVRVTVAGILISTLVPCIAVAQPAPIPFHTEPYTQPERGTFRGALGLEAESFTAVREVARVPGAPWLRLRFGDYNLGERSFITITSLQDGSQQRMDAQTLSAWQGSTAFFNGDAIEVTLDVAPGESGIFFQIDEVIVGERASGAQSVEPQEICGSTDDRVSSNDAAVGRIMTVGCTGWLISNGGGLTAGHCLANGQVLQFNVPSSLTDGTPVNPPPEDQYPITFIDSTNGGQGNDWGVFRIDPNTSGQTVVQRQGAFYRMSRDLSPTTVRDTGYGIDGPPPLFGDGPRNADSQTLQTHAGPFVSETITSPSVVVIRFRIDDENGNSGSPVIDTSNGVTIGIATNAGCTETGGSNAGTGFENNDLENAIQTFPGTNVEYVDRGHPTVSEDGTAFRPWNIVAEGLSGATKGAIVSIVRGTYNESLTINQQVTLQAPVGVVTIGSP